MFCPNCGNENPKNQKFCRTCGLKLGEISQILINEKHQAIEPNILNNKKLFEKLGSIFLIAFFGVAFGYVFYLGVYYKFQFFGKEMMALFGLFGFILLGLLSIFFFNFYKFFPPTDFRELSTEKTPKLNSKTSPKKLPEGHFEPIPSITEDSTEPLVVENKTKKL